MLEIYHEEARKVYRDCIPLFIPYGTEAFLHAYNHAISLTFALLVCTHFQEKTAPRMEFSS